MDNLKCGDNTENYVMLPAFSFSTLKKLGIHESVMEKLKKCKFADLEHEIFEISDITELEDLELLTNLYVGTIFNKLYTEDEVINNVFEIELPESFIPYSLQFNDVMPIIVWKDYVFEAKVSRYNQLIISCVGKNIPVEYIYFRLASD